MDYDKILFTLGAFRGTFYENATSLQHALGLAEKRSSLSLSLHCNCSSWISSGVSSCSCQLILKISLLELIINNIDKLLFSWAFLVVQVIRIRLQCGRLGFDSWIGKIWRREWLPTLEFLPGELRGQRNLAGYSRWGHRESDTTELFSLHFII